MNRYAPIICVGNFLIKSNSKTSFCDPQLWTLHPHSHTLRHTSFIFHTSILFTLLFAPRFIFLLIFISILLILSLIRSVVQILLRPSSYLQLNLLVWPEWPASSAASRCTAASAGASSDQPSSLTAPLRLAELHLNSSLCLQKGRWPSQTQSSVFPECLLTWGFI